MILKSEKSIKEYLKKLPDDTIIRYYLDVEYSPFPILVIEEYTRRFKKKTKSEIIKDLKFQGRLARKKTQELGKMAKSHKLVDDVTKQKSDEIIKHAKKKGFEIGQIISKERAKLTTKLKKSTKSNAVKKQISKKLRTPTQKHLEELEKLGKLKKQGLITAKEFQDTKKKILSKI
ncbi:hypothetical protein Nisw_00210 [Candidatus Nitrosopumilus sp. SW]|uniref:hypothetical protein n=1 Tax=Candidatus Nitrosopumilus sp. SW TaxID=2508726 RepID=UPI0011544F29|nr:hypothetical protein [Candidatus Nitrosopumilus sp. SW]QDI88062.1 hypothetical protein Nisw_00210 [Candidatus Nitrosopumilus sp. SW]